MTNISQSSSFEQLEQGHEDGFLDDDLLGDDIDIDDEVGRSAIGNNGAEGIPSDWNDVSPNQIMARLKLLKQEVLEQHNLRPFYKSYSNWDSLGSSGTRL